MTKPLSGQTALITGSASGIGFAIARRFAEAGANVMLSGRNQETGRAAEQALKDIGARAKYFTVDVAKEKEVRALVDATVSEFGGISILVNNAGPAAEAFGFGPLHSLPSDIFEQTMRIGLFGAFWCSKYTVPHMIEQGYGTILNISAMPATRALPNMGAYAMAKAGMDALGRQLANDYADQGIRANNIVVGTVRPGEGDVSTLPTDFDHDVLDRAVGRTTMVGTVGRYADVAATALFLASPEARFITGANIPVEGGALSKVQYPDYTEIMSA